MKTKTHQTVELPVRGMDCAGCARTVQHSIADLPGVQSVEVLLSAEKAVIALDEGQAADIDEIKQAIERSGYTVPAPEASPAAETTHSLPSASAFSQRVLWLFGLVFGVVLLVVVAGEWLGLFESVTSRISLLWGTVIVALLGYPVFKEVARATFQGRVIAHTLMTVGALAALAAGEWITAAIVVFFMRVGDYAERFTTERARESVRSLTRLAPQTARVERNGQAQELPVQEVQPGDTVLVRPGEKIPVDGEVISGQATVDQAAITGESMPVETREGSQVYAATIAQLGALRIRATGIGRDSTFGRVIQMVEEAEAHRGPVQRIADRFSGYYLPVVATIAGLTYFFSQNLMATVAVLVVACSCAFALATPVAILASVGAAAKRGLLIKGGKYLEALSRADVLLLDKTGTLTLGQPQITEILSFNGLPEHQLLALAASAEQHSEHPLAEAVRSAARARELPLTAPEAFEAVPGQGVRAQIGAHQVAVGNTRLTDSSLSDPQVHQLRSEGKTLIFVEVDGETAGVLAAADTVRGEVPEALQAIRKLGVNYIELLTGDTEQTARVLAGRLKLDYQAELLPEDKISVVRQYQKKGKTVVMIGDGVNDAPALAQADVGIAMGAAGSDVAIEAAHIALMRDDWSLIPELFQITHRTMRVVKLNIGFTALYNVAGLTLAALGLLPPIFAAAAQSLPDLGILANSARLIRQK